MAGGDLNDRESMGEITRKKHVLQSAEKKGSLKTKCRDRSRRGPGISVRLRWRNRCQDSASRWRYPQPSRSNEWSTYNGPARTSRRSIDARDSAKAQSLGFRLFSYAPRGFESHSLRQVVPVSGLLRKLSLWFLAVDDRGRSKSQTRRWNPLEMIPEIDS
jgi:hypothetical protein